MRLAADIQALLGNLDKKGGGIILPSAAGNAQGVCDMGLLSPYLPGYVKLPRYGQNLKDHDLREPMEALLRTWYPSTDTAKAWSYIPHLEADENPSISSIIQGVGDERYKALLVAGADPLGSLPDNSSILKVLGNLDLLVVMDSVPNRTSTFFEQFRGRESTLKTEVLFIPAEPPVLKSGSMTDTGRRARAVEPLELPGVNKQVLLNYIVDLGNSIRSKYKDEGGVIPEPVLELSWPLTQEPAEVAAEINGRRSGSEGEAALPPGRSWQKGDRCGNHLYRGWIEDGGWLVRKRDPGDPYGLAFYENWGWFWPWGIADPFSWIHEPDSEKGALLRWEERGGGKRSAADVLPLRPQLPIKFWRLVDKGTPFPEHHEPFHSPLPDFLTGGRSNPNLQLRSENGDKWGYLSRRPEEVFTDYPVIITMHRTGNIMGTGGITSRLKYARELGICRILEIGKEFAVSLGVETGDRLLILSPYSDEGVFALANVTGRIASFESDQTSYNVASLTLYGDDSPGANALTPPAFDFLSGGMEMKVFMGLVKKAKIQVT
jgi:formate dehydrogenase major subunit